MFFIVSGIQFFWFGDSRTVAHRDVRSGAENRMFSRAAQGGVGGSPPHMRVTRNPPRALAPRPRCHSRTIEK